MHQSRLSKVYKFTARALQCRCVQVHTHVKTHTAHIIKEPGQGQEQQEGVCRTRSRGPSG
jgi:hypothetical protein